MKYPKMKHSQRKCFFILYHLQRNRYRVHQKIQKEESFMSLQYLNRSSINDPINLCLDERITQSQNSLIAFRAFGGMMKG